MRNNKKYFLMKIIEKLKEYKIKKNMIKKEKL